MRYRLFFAARDGTERTIAGVKHISNDGGITDIWADTTTLYTSDPARGTSSRPTRRPPSSWRPASSGSGLFDFLQRDDDVPGDGADAGDAPQRAHAIHDALFLGKLWDVYGGLSVHFLVEDAMPDVRC